MATRVVRLLNICLEHPRARTLAAVENAPSVRRAWAAGVEQFSLATTTTLVLFYDASAVADSDPYDRSCDAPCDRNSAGNT
jgi:hypothetical protein